MVDKYIDAVLDYYKVSRQDILSTRRGIEISYVRKILCYVLRNCAGLSYCEIADIINHSDTYVYHSVVAVEESIDKDEMNKLISFCVESIESDALSVINTYNAGVVACWDEINLESLLMSFNDFYRDNGKRKKRGKLLELKKAVHDLLDKVIDKDSFGEIYQLDKITSNIYQKVDEKKGFCATLLQEEFIKVYHSNHKPTERLNVFAIDTINEQKIKIGELSRKVKSSGIRGRKEKTNREQLEENVKKMYGEYFGNEYFAEDKVDEYFKSLLDKCVEPHFTKAEIKRMGEQVAKKEYELFWYEVWLHALDCIHYNLPYMYAERAYYEALTLKRNNKMYKDLLHAAANQEDNIEAKFEYGMQIYDTEFEQGLECFRKALPSKAVKNPPLSSRAVCWVLAFQYEFKWEKITDKMLTDIEKDSRYLAMKDSNTRLMEGIVAREERDELTENDKLIREYLSLLPVTTEQKEKTCLQVAINIYVYLCTSMEFAKAFNSIGKLLLLGKIRVGKEERVVGTVDDCPRSRALALKSLNKAMVLGNGNAMVNWARYYMQRLPADNVKEMSPIQKEALDNYDEIKRRFKIMADLNEAIACEYYADILLKEKNMNEAISYYSDATANNRPTAALKLGKLYDQMGDKLNAYKHYKIAAKANVPGAEEAVKNCDKNTILFSGLGEEINTLKDVMQELALTKESREEQEKLLHIIKELEVIYNDSKDSIN